MILFTIYILSVIVTGFAIAGVLVSSRSNEVISGNSIFGLCSITFFPVVNTLVALMVVIALVWLYMFRPTKPKAKPPM